MIWLLIIWLLFSIINLLTGVLHYLKQRVMMVEDIILVYPVLLILGPIGTLILMGSGEYDWILKKEVWRKKN